MNRRSWRWAALAAVPVIGVAGLIFYNTRPAAMLADALEIRTLPSSVRAVRCESWGFTDVLTTCTFEVGADDFSRLLEGTEWSMEPAGGSSFGYASGPNLGEEFPVAMKYAATPKNAMHGGHLILVTNASQTRAQVDLYIE
jgi:hypothetical protein